MVQSCRSDSEHRKKRYVALAIDCSIVAIIALLSKLIIPMMKLFPECKFAQAGHPCGSCGGTRCVLNILKGNFVEAFNFNQFFFVVFCYVAVLLVVLNVAWLFNVKSFKKVLKIMADYRVVVFFAVCFVPFSLAKMFNLL